MSFIKQRFDKFTSSWTARDRRHIRLQDYFEFDSYFFENKLWPQEGNVI